MAERRLGPCKALLFDMDGTLLTSRPAIERVWNLWSARWGLDPAQVSGFLHGRRATDAIAHFLPDLDPLRRREEIDWVEEREMDDTEGVVEVPGAAAFLSGLPQDRWVVVTSAARRLAERRITAAGLPLPRALIAAEDVERGKPDPAGYLRAAELMGAGIGECIVFEDAPAGIEAGLSAGAGVVAIGNQDDAGLPVLSRIADYRGLRCSRTDEGSLCLWH